MRAESSQTSSQPRFCIPVCRGNCLSRKQAIFLSLEAHPHPWTAVSIPTFKQGTVGTGLNNRHRLSLQSGNTSAVKWRRPIRSEERLILCALKVVEVCNMCENYPIDDLTERP
ncbi:unnamed protein product [Soboliphyme baturini]|uniref:Uncharacterized protein n=1 Tax=Soboliphyme baturini TaxID=241478 RepID=A0A183IS98_9BILA|nr:unnamed protein product [Soboliphyme baturini]